jgi:nucleoid DNA-binding protein
MKLKKREMVKQIAELSGLSLGDANRAINSTVKFIQEAIRKGEIIFLSGLGSFRVKPCKAKKARNPRTGESILVPSGRKISFKPTKKLRTLINKRTKETTI